MNEKTLQDILNSSMPSLRMRLPKNNIETNIDYYGADKIDDLIGLINYLSSLENASSSCMKIEIWKRRLKLP